VNRPRFTVSVLRGLLSFNSHAMEELAKYSHDERLAIIGAKGLRDIDRAAEWLDAMRAWYLSKGEAQGERKRMQR
jgi:hypothetical protein